MNYSKGIDKGLFLYEVADLVLNHSQIVCFRNRFRITEAELYVFQEGHFDPYSFGAEGKKAGDLQSKPGQWFEHGAALEYTFGEPGKFRGILIRGIEPIEGRGEKTVSAWDTREQLFRLANNDLIRNLRLESAVLEEKPFSFGPRLQLDKKIDLKFAELPYRFYTA